MAALRVGKPARSAAPDAGDKEAAKEYKMLQLLTAKPVLYVCNVDEDSAATGNAYSEAVAQKAAAENARAVGISAAIESEVAQLENEDEQKEFLASLGLEETGLSKVIRAGYNLLGLETYFTAGPKEVRAWTFLKGSKAPQCAGIIHSDFERGFIRDEDITPTPPSWKDRMVVGDLYTGFAVFVTAAVFLLFGIMFAKIFLSGPTTVQNGLQGVVINSEVPRGRARCGVAEKTQGCVLYIMNPQRQDLNGRDFYDLAAQLTGRQRFMIETGNMRYSSIKIKPGEIAQLNIPPLQ